MTNQVIGKSMFHGYAGSYSRQPDTIIDTHPAGGAIAFGAGVVYGSNGVVRTAATGDTAAAFVGIAVRETKSATNYLSQNSKSRMSPSMKVNRSFFNASSRFSMCPVERLSRQMTL